MKTYYVVCDFGKERYCRDKFERIILVTDNKDKAYSVRFDYQEQHRDNEIVVQRWYDNEVVDDLLWYVEFHFDTNKRCWKYDYSFSGLIGKTEAKMMNPAFTKQQMMKIIISMFFVMQKARNMRFQKLLKCQKNIMKSSINNT